MSRGPEKSEEESWEEGGERVMICLYSGVGKV